MKIYTRTDQYLHWLSQIISKANRSFVTALADDSHTNLYFDWLGKRVVGRWIETDEGLIILTLNLSSLQFEWLNAAYQTIAFFETKGLTVREVEKNIEKHLPELGLNPSGFTNKLHYEIPNYSFANEAIQSIAKEHMEEWIYFRNLANKVCAILLGHLQIESEIRIWPHHFDTGIYVVTSRGLGIGFGLAMSDALVGGPYFYMTGYPTEGAIDYEDLPTFLGGRWEISEHWQGAVMPLSKLKPLSKEDYKTSITDYLLKASHWFSNQ